MGTRQHWGRAAIIGIVLVALLGVPLSTPMMTWSQPGWPASADPGWGWWVFVMGLGMLLFWGAAIGLVVLLARAFGQPGRHDALALLRERYARGEISGDEYETRRRVLQS